MQRPPLMTLLALAALLAFAPPVLAHGSLGQRPQDTVLVVGLQKDAPPLSFVGEHSFTGFEVELFRELARIMGVAFELHALPRQDLLGAVADGRMDAAFGGIAAFEGSASVDFTTPHLATGHGLMVRADDDSIRSIDDLDGKTVGAELASDAAFYLYDHAPGASVSMFPLARDAYRELEHGNVDAVFNPLPMLRYYAATRGAGVVKLVGPLYAPMSYAFAVRKGSPWKARIDDALYRFKDSGKFAALEKKWLLGPSGRDSAD